MSIPAPWRVYVIASLGRFRVDLVPVLGDAIASLGRFRAVSGDVIASLGRFRVISGDVIASLGRFRVVSGAAAVRITACCHFTGRSSRGQRAADTG